MSTTTMTYNTYNFSPVPIVNFNKTYFKTTGGFKLGSLINLSLNGTLTPLPTGTGGIVNTMPLVDSLRSAFFQDGCPFVIQCGATVLWSGHPRINNLVFNPTPDNWVQRVSYVIDMEFDEEPEGGGPDSLVPPYIQNQTESITTEFFDQPNKFAWTLPTIGLDANEFLFRYNRTISAQGTTHYEGCESAEKQAWEYARDYVLTRLNAGSDASVSGIINFDPSLYTTYNDVRILNIDERTGSASVTQTYIILNPDATGLPGNAIETFDVNVQQSVDTDLTTVSINGAIEGVDTKNYGSELGDLSMTQDKYNSASGYWNVVKSRLYYRAQLLHTDAISDKTVQRSLNIQPTNFSVGHSPTNGVINYSYSFNDRPSNCIENALTESIQIVDTNPTDIFAEIAILGRAIGPIMQDLNTITASTRSISIETVSPPTTSCSAVGLRDTLGIKVQVASLLCDFETELVNVYDTVFKTQDQENWNPKEGRYNRQVQYQYQTCSITGLPGICQGG